MTDTKDGDGAYAHGTVMVTTIASDVEQGTDAKQNNDGVVSIDISGPKRGHVFCGCCCDVRRATIVMNIVFLVFAIISVIMVTQAISTLDATEELLQDDVIRDPYNDVQNALVISMIITALSIIFMALAIYGAICFRAAFVWPNVVYLAVSFIINIIVSMSASNVGLSYRYGAINVLYGLVITAFVIYPQAFFIYEIQFSKTMSCVTYPREEQSCCCVSK